MKIKVKGDTSGATYIDLDQVEAMIVEHQSPRGEHAIRIRMESGKEYYALFATDADLVKFLKSWAGTPGIYDGSR